MKNKLFFTLGICMLVLCGINISACRVSSNDVYSLPCVCGYSVIEKDGKYGLADSRAIRIIEPAWDSVITFDNGIIYSDYGYCIVKEK